MSVSAIIMLIIGGVGLWAVSYTHLDVYKRQEEGGDDVKSSCPLCSGLHTCYNGRYREKARLRSGAKLKSRSQFGLQAATRLHEVGVASNRRSECLSLIHI